MDKLNKPFFEVSFDGLEYDDDFADDFASDFESLLPEDPSVEDCERVARHFGKMSLLRNSKSAERIIKDVQDYRIEKRIRKHILHILKSSDGVVSMSELMRRINDVDGQAGANASVSLIYVMQAEGEVKIDFQKQLLNFTLFGQQHKFYDQNIVVKLLHKH